MNGIIRMLALVAAVKAAETTLGFIRKAPVTPKPVKWGATVLLVLLATRK